MAIFVHAFPPRTHLKCVQRLVTSIMILIRIAKQYVVSTLIRRSGKVEWLALKPSVGKVRQRRYRIEYSERNFFLYDILSFRWRGEWRGGGGDNNLKLSINRSGCFFSLDHLLDTYFKNNVKDTFAQLTAKLAIKHEQKTHTTIIDHEFVEWFPCCLSWTFVVFTFVKSVGRVLLTRIDIKLIKDYKIIKSDKRGHSWPIL